MVRKIKGKWVALAAVPLVLGAQAYAAVPTEISTAITDAGSVWDDIKGYKTGIVVFLLLLGVLKLARGR
jgi:hypothetical protein